MNGDRPRETKRNLSDRGFYSAIFFDRPTHRFRDNLFTRQEFDDRKTLMPTNDMTDRTVHISRFEVIFDEHDSSSLLEDQFLWRKTSLLQGFDEFLSALTHHIEDEDIVSDTI